MKWTFSSLFICVLKCSTAISIMPPSDILPGRVDKPIEMNDEGKALTSLCSRSLLANGLYGEGKTDRL